jgi:drug/metabolite transporter, DME family
MESKSGMLPRLMIVGAAVLFSTGGAAIKACSLGAWQVASFRSGVAALVMLALLPAARRGWRGRTFVVGLAYAATMVLYVGANKLTTAANTIFLQGTAPLYILLLGPWLLGERARRRDLWFMAALAGGLILFFVGAQPRYATAPSPALGNVLGAFAGVSWGLTIIGLRWLGREEDGNGGAAAAAVACGNLLALLVCLPAALPVASATMTDWLVIVYLGVFQIGLAYVLLTAGMRSVSALETSLLLLVEPVLNPAWAWLAHGEAPGLFSHLGGATIIGSTGLKTWFDRRSPAPGSLE